MRKDTLFLTVLLLGTWVAAVSWVAHYRTLYRDTLRQWNSAETAWRQRSAGVSVEGDSATSRSSVATMPATKTVTVPDPAAPLRDRIREMEAQLADRDARIATLVQASTNRFLARAAERRERFTSPDAWRTNNPALYAEMDKRRQEAQKSMQNALARQAEFVLKRDTSNLSDDEKAQHDELVRLLDETWRITQQMQTVTSRDERHELMHTMGETIRALDPLLASERTREFYSLGLSVGYSPDEAAHFSSYLNDVIDMTSVQTLFPGVRGAPSRGSGANVTVPR